MTNNDRENFHEETRQNEKERDFNMIIPQHEETTKTRGKTQSSVSKSQAQ